MPGYEGKAFRHHQPFTADDISGRLIRGGDGSFRERAVKEGYAAGEPTVGVVVEMLASGVLEGARMVKFGKVAPKSKPAKDVWPEAEEGTISFPEFDLSDFGDFNGCMSTPYVELPFKLSVKQGEVMKVIKKGELEAKGYSELSFRLHCRTTDQETVKFVVVAVPCALAQVTSTYTAEATGRGFPGIKIHEGRARLITKEEDEQRLGLGMEPFFRLSNAQLDQNGEVMTDGVMYPTSMSIKLAVVKVLQSGMKPNWNKERAQFDDAVKSKKYKKKEPETCWPDPLQENSVDTSVETETEGEKKTCLCERHGRLAGRDNWYGNNCEIGQPG